MSTLVKSSFSSGTTEAFLFRQPPSINCRARLRLRDNSTSTRISSPKVRLTLFYWSGSGQWGYNLLLAHPAMHWLVPSRCRFFTIFAPFLPFCHFAIACHQAGFASPNSHFAYCNLTLPHLTTLYFSSRLETISSGQILISRVLL